MAGQEEKESQPTSVVSHADGPEISAQSPAQDDCPNGGYGWVCVAACFLINAHTWGMNSAFGVFLAYYLREDVFPGGTALRYAFVGGLSISVAMIISPLATIWVRELGTRSCALLGNVFLGASFIAASFATKVWHLYLSQGACFGIGLGLLFVASVNVPPQWFTTKRSFANGICAGGSGLGGLIYSLGANAMIESVGLDWAFRILGLVSFVVNGGCSLLLRDRNKQIGTTQLAFDYTLFKRFQFNLMQAWGVFSMLGYVVLLFSLPNYANNIGLTPKQGSVVGAIFQLGQMLGRPPVGYFSDSAGRLNMAGITTFLCGLYCLLIWVFAKSYGVLIFFAFISGTVAGTFWGTVAPVGAEVLGIKNLPSVLSITWVVIAIPTTFSEPIALEIAERSPAKYLGAQLFAGFMYIAAAGCLWCVRVWKLGEMESEAKAAPEDEGLSIKLSSVVKRTFAFRRV